MCNENTNKCCCGTDVGRYKALATKIRAHSLRMTHGGKSGHVGSMLSMADLLAEWRDAKKISEDVFTKIARGNAAKLLNLE